jgi:hypothetical protein
VGTAVVGEGRAEVIASGTVDILYIPLLPSYALYTIIPYRPPPAVGSAERSGPLI